MLMRRTCRCRRRGRPIARSPTAYPGHRRGSARIARCGARTCAPSGPASRSTDPPPSTMRWTPTCASDPVLGRVRDLPVELDAVDRAIGPEVDLPPLVVRVRRRPARGGVAVVRSARARSLLSVLDALAGRLSARSSAHAGEAAISRPPTTARNQAASLPRHPGSTLDFHRPGAAASEPADGHYGVCDTRGGRRDGTRRRSV